MAAIPDQELQRMFGDLQQKMVSTRSQVKMAEAQISQKQRDVKRARLTLTELSSLPKDVKTYHGVGRM